MLAWLGGWLHQKSAALQTQRQTRQREARARRDAKLLEGCGCGCELLTDCCTVHGDACEGDCAVR